MLLFGLGILLCFVFPGSMVCCYASVRNERLIDSLFVVKRPVGEYFTREGTSTLPLKGWKTSPLSLEQEGIFIVPHLL